MKSTFKNLISSYGLWGKLSESETDYVADTFRNGIVAVAGYDIEDKGYMMFFPSFNSLICYNDDFIGVAKRVSNTAERNGDKELAKKMEEWISWGGNCPVEPIVLIEEMNASEKSRIMFDFIQEEKNPRLVKIGKEIADRYSQDIYMGWSIKNNNSTLVFSLDSEYDTLELAGALISERNNLFSIYPDLSGLDIDIRIQENEIIIKDWFVND